MATFEEKLSLLSDMISFAVIDGKLHEREYGFIALVASELGINTKLLKSLFQNEMKSVPISNESSRVEQFYRLALLMHVDGVLHEKEDNALHEIGIKMGLNPQAMNITLKNLKQNKNNVIEGSQLFKTFEIQKN